jgi:hypothetical protein
MYDNINLVHIQQPPFQNAETLPLDHQSHLLAS